MSESQVRVRKSAKDRETQGIKVGLIGLLIAGAGLFGSLPRMVALGLLIAIIGGIMWGAGMARRD